LELGPTKYVPVARLDWEERIEAGVLDVPWWGLFPYSFLLMRSLANGIGCN
jgi:hypothetical protein